MGTCWHETKYVPASSHARRKPLKNLSCMKLQAAQEQRSKSIAANWIPLGTSPHGSAPTASWRMSPIGAAVAGTSPGTLFPAGTSPSGSR